MTVAGVHERELRVGGIRTLLHETGPADAREAVVFIHGNPGPSEDWIGLLNRVGGFARAVAWDAPASGGPTSPATSRRPSRATRRSSARRWTRSGSRVRTW